MDLKNKIVKVNDLSLIPFFYPQYVMKKELSFLDREKEVIYHGKMKPDFRNYLNNSTKSYISLVGKPDIDLTNRENIMEFVYNKYSRKPPKFVVDTAGDLDDEEFEFCIKTYWVCGKWPYEDDKEDITIYNLFKTTVGSTKDMLTTYLKLREKYPFYVIEGSMITFFSRAKMIDEQDVNPNYKRLLKAFNSKSGHKVKKSVMRYALQDNVNEDLKMIELLLSLR